MISFNDIDGVFQLGEEAKREQDAFEALAEDANRRLSAGGLGSRCLFRQFDYLSDE